MSTGIIASKPTLKRSLEKYSAHVKYTNVIIVTHNHILYFLGPSEIVFKELGI